MLVVPRAIDLPLGRTNAKKKMFSNGIFRNLQNPDLSFFNALKTIRSLTSPKKIIGITAAIEKDVVIVTFVNLSLQALLQP